MNDMSKFSTLIELLEHRSQTTPEKTAYVFLLDGEKKEVRVTYGELHEKAKAIAAMLGETYQQNERILLLYPPCIEFIYAFFGCLYAKMIAVPAYPPSPGHLNKTLPRLESIVVDSNAAALLTTAKIVSLGKKIQFAKSVGRFAGFRKVLERVAPSKLFNPKIKGMSDLEWISTDDVDMALAEKWEKPSVCSQDLAFLQYTSGSTGAPKGVMVSHENILYNEAMIQEAFQHSQETVVVGWLPLYHDMGLIGNVLQPLYLGTPCILMSPIHFLQKPLRWLKAISKYKATTSGAPNFAYELCSRKVTDEQKAELDLSSWTLAYNGSEPVRSDTLKKFAQTFAPCGFKEEAFYPCYGLAEATLIVSGGEKKDISERVCIDATSLQEDKAVLANPDDIKSHILTSCGATLLEQEVCIVDPQTRQRCHNGEVGEIWVHGKNVTQGYWNKPELTQQTFQATIQGEESKGHYLRTGDLGFFLDGELYVTGRIKDVIIIAGKNHYPHDLERTVEQCHPAIRPGCSAAFTVGMQGEEKLVIVAEVRDYYVKQHMLKGFIRSKLKKDQPQRDLKENVTRAMRKAVAENHELKAHSILLIKARSIPKTSSGKIQRHACENGFLNDNLEVVATKS